MNLMPYKCKNRVHGICLCGFDCDYMYYGTEMDCYEPLIVDGKKVKTNPYDGAYNRDEA